MAKILYIMKYPLCETYTLKQKFLGQIASFEALGHDVWYFSYDRQYIYLNHGEEKTVYKKTTFGSQSFYTHTLAFVDLYYSATKLISQLDLDLVYFRRYPFCAIGYRLFKMIKEKGIKLVVEIPTYPERERAKNIVRRIYVKYSEIWWSRAIKNVSLFALIGENSTNYRGRPAINIHNGISVDIIPKRKPINDGYIHMLALASMTNWHGYDRIIKSLAEYDGEYRDKIVIDMVGDEGDGSLKKWKKLSTELGLNKQVIFHGRLEGKLLDDIFNIATIGLCSLGMYRNGFKSGSILKLREFTARGLPFVYSANDPSIDEGLGYCMKVSNDDTPINMNDVVNFTLSLRNKTGLTDKMRNYAAENMTWDTQIKKITDVL